MDELRVIQHVGSSVEPAPEARERARSTLEREVAANRSIGGLHRRRRVRYLAVAAAIVAGALLAVVIVPPLTGGESRAAATLRGLGRLASMQPYARVGPGDLLYVKTEAVWQTCTTVLGEDGPSECRPDRVTREIWKSPDGSGRIKQNGVGAMDQTFGPGELEFGIYGVADLSSLPTDASALREWVEDFAASHGGNPIDEQMFMLVGDLLRETDAPPGLRAALFEVAAGIDGVEVVEPTQDRLGRNGIGVGFHDGDNFEVIIFDTTTTTFLGERTHGPDGEVVGWSVVAASGVVDSVRDRPEGG